MSNLQRRLTSCLTKGNTDEITLYGNIKCRITPSKRWVSQSMHMTSEHYLSITSRKTMEVQQMNLLEARLFRSMKPQRFSIELQDKIFEFECCSGKCADAWYDSIESVMPTEETTGIVQAASTLDCSFFSPLNSIQMRYSWLEYAIYRLESLGSLIWGSSNIFQNLSKGPAAAILDIKAVKLNNELPTCFRTSLVIPAFAKEVFDSILSIESYERWNQRFLAKKMACCQQNHQQEDRIQFRMIPGERTPLISFSDREFILQRRWTKNSDGSMTIMMKSCQGDTLDNGVCIRSEMPVCIYHISPKLAKEDSSSCLLTYVVSIDAKGWLMGSMNFLFTEWFMGHILDLRGFFERQQFTPVPFLGYGLNEEHSKLNTLAAAGSLQRAASVLTSDKILPLLTPTMWSRIPADTFLVRGATFLKDGIKGKSAESIMRLEAVDLFQFSDGNVDNIAAAKLQDIPQGEHKWLVIQFQIPGPPYYGLVLYFYPRKEATFPNKLWDSFVKESDSYRDKRFKIIPRVTEGNWVVKKAVGTNTPVILGSKITQRYFVKEQYVEVDCNVGSSKVASAVVDIVKGQSKNVVIDIAILVQGMVAQELPEVVLGTARLNRINLNYAKKHSEMPNLQFHK